MPKRSRLTSDAFKGLKVEKRLSGALFSLSVAPHEAGFACAFVVSKKVSPHAVDRNRIKRRCRAILSPLWKTLPPKAYIFTARAPAKTASFKETSSDIEQLLSRVTR